MLCALSMVSLNTMTFVCTVSVLTFAVLYRLSYLLTDRSPKSLQTLCHVDHHTLRYRRELLPRPSGGGMRKQILQFSPPGNLALARSAASSTLVLLISCRDVSRMRAVHFRLPSQVLDVRVSAESAAAGHHRPELLDS